jgi:hypothetical protein
MDYNLITKIQEVVAMEDKVAFFKDRTLKHIDLVQQNAKKVVAKYPEYAELTALASLHDASKFKEPEYTPYLELTWNKFKGIKDVDARTNKASLHHITTNPHHPECWNKQEANLDPNNRDKSVKCLDASNMPEIFIGEMVCDWQAMSMELGTNTCREWWDKVRNVRWKFSPQQESTIEKLISVFE